MLKVSNINNLNSFNINKTDKYNTKQSLVNTSLPSDLKKVNYRTLQAYHPSFMSNEQTSISKKEMLSEINSVSDKEMKSLLASLDKKGILDNNESDDGTSVLDNIYKIIKEPRIQGLNSVEIAKEVMKALDNPSSITQKFGDIPDEIQQEIETQTGEKLPEEAKQVQSSCCVVASMEYNLAGKKPAEFARFAQGLSSQNYSVEKNIKMSDISDGMASGLWLLREFNTESNIANNWEDVSLNIKPDRNAIVRARMQASYRDNNERSSLDVLMQSALLNLGSQNSYNSITDKRTGKFNPDDAGLTDFEKNFVEQVVFETPKISVVYQNLDENGVLTGYNCKPEETKQHILKSLELGHNVIIGYTHMDENKKVDGGHEITIIGYEQDKNGKGYFICNDTDDEIDEPIRMSEDELLPLIHHAGISKEALSQDDIVVEPWREIVDNFQNMIRNQI